MPAAKASSASQGDLLPNRRTRQWPSRTCYTKADERLRDLRLVVRAPCSVGPARACWTDMAASNAEADVSRRCFITRQDERVFESATVRTSVRALAIEEIWKNLATDLHPTLAPVIEVRFEGRDVVLRDAIGDGTLSALSAVGQRGGARLPLPLVVTLRAALVAGASAIFQADFRGLCLSRMPPADAVVLFGGVPRVRLSAFEARDDGRLRALDLDPKRLATMIEESLGLVTRDRECRHRQATTAFSPAGSIATLLPALRRADKLELSCSLIRELLVTWFGGAMPRASLALCDGFTPWAQQSCDSLATWERHLEAALTRLEAHDLAAISVLRRERREASERWFGESAKPRAAAAPAQKQPEIGVCELLRERAHDASAWLAFAEVSALAGGSEFEVFACAEAICAARGAKWVIERVSRLLGAADARGLARQLDAAGSSAVARWLVLE